MSALSPPQQGRCFGSNISSFIFDRYGRSIRMKTSQTWPLILRIDKHASCSQRLS
jgi:hypothetical protein